MSSEPVKKAPIKAAGKPVMIGNQRIAEHMLPQHLPLTQAFGAGRQHILLADFFQEGILGQHGVTAKLPSTMAVTGKVMCQR
jgi:hypothetical protein